MNEKEKEERIFKIKGRNKRAREVSKEKCCGEVKGLSKKGQAELEILLSYNPKFEFPRKTMIFCKPGPDTSQ